MSPSAGANVAVAAAAAFMIHAGRPLTNATDIALIPIPLLLHV
jgi:hypothetical protein